MKTTHEENALLSARLATFNDAVYHFSLPYCRLSKDVFIYIKTEYLVPPFHHIIYLATRLVIIERLVQYVPAVVPTDFCTVNQISIPFDQFQFHQPSPTEERNQTIFSAWGKLPLMHMGLVVAAIFDHDRKQRKKRLDNCVNYWILRSIVASGEHT